MSTRIQDLQLLEPANSEEGARLKAASEQEFQPGSLSDLDKLNREFPLSQINTLYAATLKDTYNFWQSGSYFRLDETKRQLLIKISAGYLPTADEVASLTLNDIKARNKNNINIVTTCSFLVRWHGDHGQPATAQYYEWLLKNIYHKVIVRHFYNPTEKREREDHTLLHWAAATGQVDEVERLYNPQEIALYYTERQNQGTAYSPLRWASLNGHLEVVRKLTTLGLPVNTADGTSKLTPLHMAAWAGHQDIEVLLKEQKAAPDADSTGQYPSYYDTERRLMRQTRQDKAEAELAAANAAAAAVATPPPSNASTQPDEQGPMQQARLVPRIYRQPQQTQQTQQTEETSTPPQSQQMTTPAVVAAKPLQDQEAVQAQRIENPLINDLRKLLVDWKNETGARSQLKYKMIEKLIPILEAQADQSPKHLFELEVPLINLGLTPQEIALFKQQMAMDSVDLKYILDYQRKLFRPRGSTEFFQKPESARNLLMKHYPIKSRLLDYIHSVLSRLTVDDAKNTALAALKKKIQQSDATTLTGLMAVTTPDGQTLTEILDIQRKTIKTRHATALKDFYKNFADKIEEEDIPSLKK